MNQIIKESFYFVRHGETELNKNGIFMGNFDIPLNSNGIIQASKASHILEKTKIKTIVSSPLLRARNTAEIISGKLGIDVKIVDGFAEYNLGDLQGLSKEQNTDKYDGWLAGNKVENAESRSDFINRIVITTNYCLTVFRGPILIVAHAGVYSAILKDFFDIETTDMFNGQITHNHYSREGWKCDTLNSYFSL